MPKIPHRAVVDHRPATPYSRVHAPPHCTNNHGSHRVPVDRRSHASMDVFDAGRPQASSAAAQPLLERACGVFVATNLCPQQRQALRAHLARIRSELVLPYSRNLLTFVTQPGCRICPLLIDHDVFEHILAAGADNSPKIVSLALQLCEPHDQEGVRTRLYASMCAWPDAIFDAWPLVSSMLKVTADPRTRRDIMLQMPRWQNCLKDSFVDYLRALEPLWPHLASTDLDALERNILINNSRHNNALTRDDFLDDAILAGALHDTACLDDELIEAERERLDRDHPSTLWRNLGRFKSENMMTARRHFATHAAVATVSKKLPRRLPTSYVVAIIDLFWRKLNDDKAVASLYGATPQTITLFYKSFKDKEIVSNSGPLIGNITMTYLRDQAMPVCEFVALVWQAIQSYQDTEKTWANSAQARTNMTASFFAAVARLQEERFYGSLGPPNRQHGANGARIKVYSRRCQVAVAQELMSVLSGYYDFSLDVVTPEQLLCALGAEAFGDERDDMVDHARMVSFAEHAQQRAKDIFRRAPREAKKDPSSPTPEEVHFGKLLQDYLNYDPIFAEAQLQAASAIQ